ncbi:MAG TPA: DUF6438 domain-containing protein [Bacteroidia bacterium]|jgi:hypothetical protein|nr:DUF6438 domain-containing protein [Bacteroidia bacterium]
MKLFISSILFLLLAPCNSQQKLANSEDYSKTTIVYAETPCFGECPIFNMTLDGASMVATFKGEANTPKIGTFTKTISTSEFARFMEALDKAKFYQLNNEYMGRVPDFPIREITVIRNGKTKKVRDRSEAPPELGELEQVFKTFANTDGWNKTEINGN